MREYTRGRNVTSGSIKCSIGKLVWRLERDSVSEEVCVSVQEKYGTILFDDMVVLAESGSGAAE